MARTSGQNSLTRLVIVLLLSMTALGCETEDQKQHAIKSAVDNAVTESSRRHAEAQSNLRRQLNARQQAAVAEARRNEAASVEVRIRREYDDKLQEIRDDYESRLHAAENSREQAVAVAKEEAFVHGETAGYLEGLKDQRQLGEAERKQRITELREQFDQQREVEKELAFSQGEKVGSAKSFAEQHAAIIGAVAIATAVLFFALNRIFNQRRQRELDEYQRINDMLLNFAKSKTLANPEGGGPFLIDGKSTQTDN